MNPLSQRGDSGFTLAGFLIIAALGASLWKGAPLDSVRPVGSQVTSYEQQYSQQVPARLWQDPFKAVSTHELTVAEGSRAISFVQSPAGAIRELMQRPGSGKTSSVTNLTIIAVMLNPGLYPELEERRRRRRYAVLAGLSEEHFVPRNSEVLSVFYLPKVFQGSSKAHLCRKSILRHGTDRLRTLQANCFSVPFEWYDYEDGQRKAMDNQQALILWINESQFADSPFLRLKMLLEELLPEDQKSTETVRISFNLLGPARSDSLKNMVNSDVADIKEWLCNLSKLSEFNIFSPTATVADKDIAASVADKDRTGTASEERYPLPKLQEKLRCEPPQTDRLPMHFLRTIQSDDVLIDKVTTELKHNRMIKSQDKIVLLSEWDTYFGRSLPRAFEKRYCDKKNGSECHLFHYSYMRGIDGVVSGETTPSFQKISTKTKNSEFSSSLEQTNLRRPVGSGQFDYLRRLANEIRQKDREWRLGDGNGVKAVVLLGSDVYDKLLILRALRPELSGALFVTTDLDAQFLHPSEYNWARGLIMATTYDLKLSSEIQKTTMPFRDSYQTSMYLSTRLIFNDQLRSQIGIENCPKKNEVAGNQSNSQDKIYELIPAQLFEVGRQRLISLRPHTYSTHFWNDTTTRSFAKSIAFGAFMIAVIGIFALHHLRPEAGRFVFFAGSVVLAFAVLGMPALLSSTDGQVEPFDFMSGVSVWPAIFMRLFASALSMMFIWIVIQKLRRNWEDLGSRFFAISFQKEPEGITLSDLFKNLCGGISDLIKKRRKIRLEYVLPWLMVATVILVMMWVLPAPTALAAKLIYLMFVFVLLIVSWWAVTHAKIWKNVRVLSINQLDECCPLKGDAKQMWKTYGNYGETHQRFFRTIGYVLVYFFFASILFALLGAPSSPCRGNYACGVAGATLGFGVLFMLIVLFLVFDSARLCICWVDSMRREDFDWSKTKLHNLVKALKLPIRHAKAWMVVYLIGERTATVTRLIYYPVIIILLLLLARSTYFDNWDFPQALAIVIAVNFSIALSGIMRLNYMARSVRNDILRGLQEEVFAHDESQIVGYDKSQTVEYEADPAKTEELIKQLEGLRIGAYLRVWDQPPVRATLMLLGGAALTYAEYLSVFIN